MRRGKCSHRGLYEVARPITLYGNAETVWGRSAEFVIDGKRVYLAMTAVCKCGWLSLGPANDDDERVAVEIRAATLAASENADALRSARFWSSLLGPQHVDDAIALAYCIASHSSDANRREE